ncbi:CmpA/NrtA family ABC transporter substrate-binding protein [Desertibaculum subflavum]|uniref:CmpA/NrtA family ABC transporter substrate-binding protein n=1 Tax=Desertibaculum subflavum TaxID=2268458 RepID=UPI0013C4DFF3
MAEPTSGPGIEKQGIEKPKLTLGFVPLSDCAPLVVARAHGLFARFGLDVTLSAEPSWANIRDKVAVGTLDGAHMLAALPIAATLGLGGLSRPMVTALSLNLNGNGITFSNALWQAAVATGLVDEGSPASLGAALKQVVERRRAAGEPALTFAVVFPFSSHNYLLRYWLASHGIAPDRDVAFAVVPPPLMVARLEAGHIDGFCVGAPWNQRAAELGIGRVALLSNAIWSHHPEKVLGVTRDFAESCPNTHAALIAALIAACRWLDQPGNGPATAELMARKAFVDMPAEMLAPAYEGWIRPAAGEAPRPAPGLLVFHQHAANFPWLSHAEWTLAQMRRWGQIGPEVDIRAVAATVYRPDIYRAVTTALGVACPAIDRKAEGIHGSAWPLAAAPIPMGADRFCDGAVFDPDAADAAAGSHQSLKA